MKPEEDYSHILKEVLHEVQDLDRGVLFTCITIMAPENSKEIIKHFAINPSASFYDDLQVLNKIPSFQPVLKRVEPMNMRSPYIEGLVRKPLDWSPSFSVGLIIVVALVIVSLYSFLGHNDVWGRKQRGKVEEQLKKVWPGNDRDNNQHTSSPQEKCGADLWLIVPCKRIDSFLKEDLLKKSIPLKKTVTLVNDSVYFLAKSIEDTNPPKIQTDDGWKEFPEGGDLLIQLRISDGGDLIGEDLKRSLSQKIDAKEEITIEKIGLLSDLNNLQEFNRV